MKTKIDPGEGYRLLNTLEERAKGDEYYDYGAKRWVPSGALGPAPNENKPDDLIDMHYRRRIVEWRDTQKGSPIHVTETPSAGFDVPIRPMFERRAQRTLKRVTDTFGQRGTEYGDTMRDCQWLVIRAVAKQLGVDIPPDKARAIAIAGMVDIKYQRYQGGYKDDNGVDGIAYQAFLTDEMSELAGGAK